MLDRINESGWLLPILFNARPMTTMMCSLLSVIITVSKIKVYLIITILVMAVYLLVSTILLSISRVDFNFCFTGSINNGRFSSYLGRGLCRLWGFIVFISI